MLIVTKRIFESYNFIYKNIQMRIIIIIFFFEIIKIHF